MGFPRDSLGWVPSFFSAGPTTILMGALDALLSRCCGPALLLPRRCRWDASGSLGDP